MKIFFSGIGGSGVSAIAGFMRARGHSVSGSDRAFDLDPAHPLLDAFRRMGVAVYAQDGSGIDGSLDLAVFSTAVEGGTPEVSRAGALGVPIKKRPDYLAELAAPFKAIAVAGTSGKSTTSGMLAFLMHRLGMGPNFIGGGRVKALKSLSPTGNFLAGPSEHLVIEACESDGSIVNYRPEHAIVLNLDLDHHPVDKTAGMFRTLVNNTRGAVAANADDPNLRAAGITGTVSFSTDNPSDFRAEDITLGPFGSSFKLKGVRFGLSVPGMHNIYDALAALAMLSALGVAPGEAAPFLKGFTGVERRFDVHLNNSAGLVVDDYAHSPHKIAALMQATARLTDRVCYIFQPHGFGPTRLMKDGYIRAFVENLRAGDRLLVLPIFYAGGTAVRDISSMDIVDGVVASGKPAGLLPERGGVFGRLGPYRCFVVMGARDESLSAFASDIAGALKAR